MTSIKLAVGNVFLGAVAAVTGVTGRAEANTPATPPVNGGETASRSAFLEASGLPGGITRNLDGSFSVSSNTGAVVAPAPVPQQRIYANVTPQESELDSAIAVVMTQLDANAANATEEQKEIIGKVRGLLDTARVLELSEDSQKASIILQLDTLAGLNISDAAKKQVLMLKEYIQTGNVNPALIESFKSTFNNSDIVPSEAPNDLAKGLFQIQKVILTGLVIFVLYKIINGFVE